MCGGPGTVPLHAEELTDAQSRERFASRRGIGGFPCLCWICHRLAAIAEHDLGMTRIAHLSDLHLIEAAHARRETSDRLRLSLLSFGRPLDDDDRKRRLRRALHQYRTSGADHLVITGDLTEDGTDAQFETLAEVLAESRIDPREITLTAGNHDAYADRGAFARALGGPLRDFVATSGEGAVTVLDQVVIAPISTVIAQPLARSAGAIAEQQLDHVEHMARGFKGSRRAIAIAQHHQPYGYSVSALNWIDGLQNHVPVMGLLQRHAEMHVLHGHRHHRADIAVALNGPARVFGTTACVEDRSPLRLYEASDGQLRPIDSVLTSPRSQTMPNVTLTRATA